jgi:hypothetical protein
LELALFLLTGTGLWSLLLSLSLDEELLSTFLAGTFLTSFAAGAFFLVASTLAFLEGGSDELALAAFLATTFYRKSKTS